MVELVDTLDLGSSAARCVGSSPILGKISGNNRRILAPLSSAVLFALPSSRNSKLLGFSSEIFLYVLLKSFSFNFHTS